MDLRDLKIQKFTYEELAEALMDLQFKNVSTAKFFKYTHEPSGAIIQLPLYPKEELVKPAYYADIVFRLIWHKITVYKQALIDIVEVNRIKRQKLAKAMGVQLMN